jgi:hypothetical protein
MFLLNSNCSVELLFELPITCNRQGHSFRPFSTTHVLLLLLLHLRTGTFLLNNVALFSHDIGSELLVGALELLPLSANLLLLQRSTAAAHAHSSLDAVDASCNTDSTACSAGGHPYAAGAIASSSSCSGGAQLARPAPHQHWLLTVSLGGSWLLQSSGDSSSSHMLCWWLLLAGVSRLLLPLLASHLQLAGMRSRMQHIPAPAAAALQS